MQVFDDNCALHGTVFLSSSPTTHLLAPLENISRPTYFQHHLEHGIIAAY